MSPSAGSGVQGWALAQHCHCDLSQFPTSVSTSVSTSKQRGWGWQELVALGQEGDSQG